MNVQYGDKVGYIFPNSIQLPNGEFAEKYKLVEGTVNEVIKRNDSYIVKTDRFYALDSEELETSTRMMDEGRSIMIVKQPFVLTENARARAEHWILTQNEKFEELMKDFDEEEREVIEPVDEDLDR